MQRRLLLTAACMAMFACAGMAKDGRGGGGYGFLGAYGAMPGYDDANAALKPLKFPAFSTRQFMFGGGGMALIGNIAVGGYGFGGEQSVVSDSLHTRLTAEYSGGMFEMGWMPISARHVKIGPALGIGGAGFKVRGSRTDNGEPSFDELLFKGSQSWEISNSGFALAPALNILIPIQWAGLYLKVGYIWVPSDQDWGMANNVKIGKGPALHSSGPFAALQVMFGGSGSDVSERTRVKTELKPDEENEEKSPPPPPPEAPPKPGD